MFKILKLSQNTIIDLYILVLFLHFGGRQQQIALCWEIENNFSLHQVGGHLHLWSHKSEGGGATQVKII